MTNHNPWKFIISLPPLTITIIIMGKFSYFFSLLSNPLFSTLLTLYLLILLYLPTSLLRLLLSPLLISTSILLFLLRLGTSQQLKTHHGSPTRVQTRMSTEPRPVILDARERVEEKEACNWVEIRASGEPEPEARILDQGRAQYCLKLEPEPKPELEPEEIISGRDHIPNQKVWPEPRANRFYPKTYVGWEVGAPLEIIYEAYEEEEEDEEDQDDAFGYNFDGKIERYPSLSRYYPESDSECSSSLSWDAEEEGEREELIEIALDYYGHKGILKKVFHDEKVQIVDEDDDDDDDNLIEIDLSPTRTNSGFC